MKFRCRGHVLRATTSGEIGRQQQLELVLLTEPVDMVVLAESDLRRNLWVTIDDGCYDAPAKAGAKQEVLADELLRFVAALPLQDHPIKVQKERAALVNRALQALRPYRNKLL